QLALANQLGARLAAMTAIEAILEAAVEELHGAFRYYLCAAVRLRDDDRVESVAERSPAFTERTWGQHRDAGRIDRCLRTQVPVLCNDVAAEPDYCTS